MIPRTSKGLEPLCAVYGKRCIPHIERQVANGNMKITNFFRNVRVCEVNISGLPFSVNERKAFFNLNRREDLVFLAGR